MDNLFRELRRRNVFRVAGVYAVVGWLLAQVAATLEGAVGLPGWFDGMVVSLLLIGFPVALILAWALGENRTQTRLRHSRRSGARRGSDCCGQINRQSLERGSDANHGAG